MSTCDDSMNGTNWNICVFCQENKPNETLQCPAESKRPNKGAGYETIAGNIVQFHELGFLPMKLNVSRLDNRSGIGNTFLCNKARWHKNCYLRFNSTELNRARKRNSSAAMLSDEGVSSSVCKHTRSSTPLPTTSEEKLCFFCDQRAAQKDPLHKASSFGMNSRVRRCALALQDHALIAKLSAGDMIAIDAMYHLSCLASLYKKESALYKEDNENDFIKQAKGIALAELVAYIEDTRETPEKPPIFKLSDLAEMYNARMEQLTMEAYTVHSTRLKDRILWRIPDMQACKKGRNTYLVSVKV